MMRLEKYQGLGNDFLILLDDEGTQPVDEATARALCDRHLGLGADGVIRATRADPATGAQAAMTLRNADGSPAETSGASRSQMWYAPLDVSASKSGRLLRIGVGVVVAAALIAYYVAGYLMVTPPVVAATGSAVGVSAGSARRISAARRSRSEARTVSGIEAM